MFTCSICAETFVGIHEGTTYTTQCGHVFHYQCLMPWLDRSHTCPHCRSPVLENTLIKLFLEVDPNARETWDRKTDEEINKLKEELKGLKDHHISSINRLDLQLNTANAALESNKKLVDTLKNESEAYMKKHIEITAELKVMMDEKQNCKSKYLEQKEKTHSLQKDLYNLQSENSATIDKLKREIADLKSEKEYFQRSHHDTENIKIDQPCSSKMSIENENENAISLQNQTKSQDFGHDLQLQLSANQFLSGCVFLIVELHIEHEANICSKSIVSKFKIIEYGGLVKRQYSACVTHVICMTQKHHIVEQAIKDGKRCVTDYWLRDIIARKSIIPPWLAHHFPFPNSIHNLPCTGLNISIINFGINEYYRIKSMIELVGGCVIEEPTEADIIISMKLDGEIVKKAINRMVNVQWINDIIFGVKCDLKEPISIKYQQFDSCNPFLVNYEMVSHLIEAWKTPLIYKNQPVYDLTSTSSDSPTSFKRQKTIPVIKNNDVAIPYVRTLTKSKPSVMFSGFSADDKEVLKMILYLYGGSVASRLFVPTHLVVNKPNISLEFFSCLPTVQYVVNANWLKDSHSCLKLLDEKGYTVDYLQDEFMGLCHVPTILYQNSRRKLFESLTFFLAPAITSPPIYRLEDMISSAGGILEKTRRSLKLIQEAPAFSYFVISCQEDNYLNRDLLLSGIHNVVYSYEFITCSLLAQELLIHKFSM